jgi:hypothetical protein
MKRRFALPRLTLLLTLAMALTMPVRAAHACACCTNEGQRHVQTQSIDDHATGILTDIRFDPAAHLYTGEGDADGGWTKSDSPDFQVAVTKNGASWTFSFSQPDALGTLTFAIPKSVTKFEVDPREPASTPAPSGQTDNAGSSGGLGPVLYKEWRMTAPARGTGLFAAVTGGDQQATLILHGRGNSCTDSGQFTAWTVVLHGSKGTTSFFGTLSAQ